MSGWVSPRLGIRFELAEELQLYRPDGTPFFSFTEINRMLEQERQRADEERQRADELEALLQQYRDRFGELDR
jgi:predicted RNase H-like nuclease (RuvC/YqgF family)